MSLANPRLTTIGFDADDTLWQNEQFFRLAEDHFVSLLAGHAEVNGIKQRLLDAERRNLQLYGFGIKGFTLSMVETAIEVTEGKVPAEIIASIVKAGKCFPIPLRHCHMHAKPWSSSLAGSGWC